MPSTNPNNTAGALPDHQVRALIRLLGDESEYVAETVRAEILALGERAVPYLQEVMKSGPAQTQEAIHTLLDDIGNDEALRHFEAFSSGPTDLEEGAFLLARVLYPQLDTAAYQHQLDQMADTLRPRLNNHTDPEAVMAIMHPYLFEELGFKGNTTDYGNPENSYINRVLDLRLGIPISLSALYLFLARRLNLPVMGVGLPGHFLLSYRTEARTFLIDPFNKGNLLTREMCIEFVTRNGRVWQEDFLSATADRDILARMIRNLIGSYTGLGETLLAERMAEHLKHLIH